MLLHSFGKPPKQFQEASKSDKVNAEGEKKKSSAAKSAPNGKENRANESKEEQHGESSNTKKRPRVIQDSESEEDEEEKVVKKKERSDSVDDKPGKGAMEQDEDVESEDNKDEEDYEEEEALEDEKEKAKEGKEIKKLAAIFEKQPPTETKASWKQGEAVPYSALADTFVAIEATTKRLIILETLTNFFVKVIRLSPDDLLPCVYLCINRLCPDYEGLELGIGESLLIKSIAQSTGRDVARLKKDLEQKGDLGLVAIVSAKKDLLWTDQNTNRIPLHSVL
jgi:DNA ligase-1